MDILKASEWAARKFLNTSLFWRSKVPSAHLLLGYLTRAQKQEFYLYLEMLLLLYLTACWGMFLYSYAVDVGLDIEQVIGIGWKIARHSYKMEGNAKKRSQNGMK